MDKHLAQKQAQRIIQATETFEDAYFEMLDFGFSDYEAKQYWYRYQALSGTAFDNSIRLIFNAS